jgi:hypothetical protein
MAVMFVRITHNIVRPNSFWWDDKPQPMQSKPTMTSSPLFEKAIPELNTLGKDQSNGNGAICSHPLLKMERSAQVSHSRRPFNRGPSPAAAQTLSVTAESNRL